MENLYHWTYVELYTLSFGFLLKKGSDVIFKTLFVRFIRHSEGAVIVVVVARDISHVFM